MSPEVSRYSQFREVSYSPQQRLMYLLIQSYDTSERMDHKTYRKFLATSLRVPVKKIDLLRSELTSLGIDVRKKRKPVRGRKAETKKRIRRDAEQLFSFDSKVEDLFNSGISYIEMARKLEVNKSTIANSLHRLRKENPGLRRR